MCPKNVGVQKTCGSNKIFGQKNFGLKNFVSIRFKDQKKFWSKKIVCPKKCWVPKKNCIANLSLLPFLEPFKKFLVVVRWWSRPVLGFRFSKAEQQDAQEIRIVWLVGVVKRVWWGRVETNFSVILSLSQAEQFPDFL